MRRVVVGIRSIAARSNRNLGISGTVPPQFHSHPIAPAVGELPASQDVPLAISCNRSIASEGRQDLFMSEVLAPCLEFFR